MRVCMYVYIYTHKEKRTQKFYTQISAAFESYKEDKFQILIVHFKLNSHTINLVFLDCFSSFNIKTTNKMISEKEIFTIPNFHHY